MASVRGLLNIHSAPLTERVHAAREIHVIHAPDGTWPVLAISMRKNKKTLFPPQPPTPPAIQRPNTTQ